MRRSAERVAIGGLMLLVGSSSCLAQRLPPWAEELFGRRFENEPRWEEPDVWREPRQERRNEWREYRDYGGDIREGGARPTIAAVAPPVVPFPHAYPANSIVIVTGERKLYYVLDGNQAYEYAIGVGRDGFGWTGTETVSRKQAWPDWHPPAEMRDRDPSLPEKMTGGIKNPLGAMALYLGDTLYRIHGTNDAKSIGRAESSGCFRMLNSAVLHLASLTEVGTPVTVVSTLPPQQAGRVPDPIATSSKSKPAAPPPRSAPAAGGPPVRVPGQNSAPEHTFQAR